MFRKIARPMLASVYVADGVDTLINTEAHISGTEAALGRIRKVVPMQYRAFVPRDPELVARGIGGMKVAAGSSLALGKFQRVSAAVLAVTAIPSLVGRYAFWSADSSEDKASQRTGFLSQVGLLGGLLITVSDTQGKPDLVWRSRHAAKVANKKVHQALPGKSDTEKILAAAGDKVGDFSDSAKSFAAVGAAKASSVVESGQERAHDFWDDKGRDAVGSAADKAAAYVSHAQDSAGEYFSAAQDYIKDNKDDWLGAFASNAKAMKHRAVAAAQLAQESADHAASLAADKAAPYRKKAAKAAKRSAKNAARAKAKALKALEKKFG